MKKKKLFLLLALLLLFLPCNAHAKSEELFETREYFITNNSLPSENLVSNKGSISNPILGSGTSGSISNSYCGGATSKQVNTIYKGMKSFKTTINVKSTKLYVNNLYNALQQAFLKDPYLQDSIYSYSYSGSGNRRTGQIYTISIKYNASKKTLQKRYNSLKNAVNSATNSIGTGLSKTEVLVATHDYLIKRCTYDLPYSYKLEANKNKKSFVPDYNAHSAYGVLCRKSGVCSGYAYAYRLILAAYGIDSKVVESQAMNHAWNLVKLNNQWYHVDVTWDDPDASTSWTGNGSGDLIYYTYFLLNDTEMLKAQHYSWTYTVRSSSTVYSNMPRYSSKYQIFSNGNWYVQRHNSSKTQFSYWLYTTSGSSTRLVTSITPFYTFKNRLFYQPDSITLCSMNFDTSMNYVHNTGIGTSFTLAGADENTNVFYLTSQYGTHSVVIPEYELRTTDYATKISMRSKITVKKGKSATLSVTLGPSYSISDRVRFKVNNAGKKIIKTVKTQNCSYQFKGKKKGTATITVTVPNTNLKKTCKVTVK